MVRQSLNKRKILSLLEEHDSLTALQLAKMVYEKKLEYKYQRGCSEYNSVLRSLRSLEREGKVKRTSGRIQWSKTETK